MFTAIADIKPPAALPVTLAAASCAKKAIRPPHIEKVGPAGLFGARARIEDGFICGKILGDRKRIRFIVSHEFREPVCDETLTDAVSPTENVWHWSEVHFRIK